MHYKFYYTFTFITDFQKEKILKLDKNVGLILRNYDKNIKKNKLQEIKEFCKKNKRKFYLANDIKLALNLNLDGVYISSYNKQFNIKKYKTKKNFLVMGSAHNLLEANIKKKQGVSLIFLSPLFKTKNYKKNLGIIKFNILSKLINKKIIALGGINNSNIKKLKMTYSCGFSAITYFKMN